jgi:hypothetical protein
MQRVWQEPLGQFRGNSMRFQVMRFQVITFWCLLLLTTAAPVGRAREARPTKPADDSAAPVTDLYAAMETGDLEARLIPQSSKGGTVIFTNTTDRPLTIKLPSVFAGINVLAQRRAGGAAAGGLGGNLSGAGGSQGLGGAFGGGGVGGGGIGGAGGVFSIGPERVTKLKVVAVCLEHGKAEPNPRLSYELAPISRLTNDAAVIEVVRLLGQGEIGQPAAQAAAWHLANGLSWQQLAAKIGIRHIGGQTEPYFTAGQVEQAQQIAREAHRRAMANAADESPGASAGRGNQ